MKAAVEAAVPYAGVLWQWRADTLKVGGASAFSMIIIDWPPRLLLDFRASSIQSRTILCEIPKWRRRTYLKQA
jgi:hypothetical protein